MDLPLSALWVPELCTVNFDSLAVTRIGFGDKSGGLMVSVEKKVRTNPACGTG